MLRPNSIYLCGSVSSESSVLISSYLPMRQLLIDMEQFSRTNGFSGVFHRHGKRQTLPFFLELYPIVTAAVVWCQAWKNHKNIFVTDNQALVAILNQKTSTLKPIMLLHRILVLHCLRFNIEFKSSHIPGQLNLPSRCPFSIAGCSFQRMGPKQRQSSNRNTIRSSAGELVQGLENLLRASLPPSSVQTYRRACQTFNSFCESNLGEVLD